MPGAMNSRKASSTGTSGRAARQRLDKLFELRPQPALQACLRLVAERARRELDAARRRRVPRRAKPLTLAGRLTVLHLERLRRAAYDPFDPRVIAAAPFDIWRLLGTAITGRF